MSGLYNHTNHESEDISRRAAAALARGIAHVYESIAAIEIQDRAAFERRKAEALEQLRNSRDLFSAATGQLSKYVVKQPPPGSELGTVLSALSAFGYGPEFMSTDIGSIPQQEINRFIEKFEATEFPVESTEHDTIKGIVDAEIRLVRVGLFVARFAAIEPG